MPYSYANERDELFTDDGQRMFLAVRDNAKRLLEDAGAFRAEKAWRRVTGSSWTMLAALDRLVELGEIRELTDGQCWGQNRVFVQNDDRGGR